MDDKIQAELAQLDPTVPFRATSSHAHQTWAHTFHSRPELYIQPQTLEEIQKIVKLARRCRRRIVVVGCGHSPSDLTCSSSWMVNLDGYNKVVSVDTERRRMVVQGGRRLGEINNSAKWHDLTLPNLGSINVQSIVGAISTATHGSSLRHGLLSQAVRSLKIVLSDGSVVHCSKEEDLDLFRAGLVSLGALGIIVEVELELAEAARIEWEQTLKPLDQVLASWDKDLWTRKEFTRVWWLPYMKRAIVWSAEKTDKPLRDPVAGWYGGSVGFHTYHILLWLSNKIPSILPAVEWFVFGMQYGFSDHSVTSAVEEMRTGLLMNCLYSQFVNEWALPLEKGPEAITRLSAWINGEEGSGIPFSSKGLYVHAPIEVRVSDTSRQEVRPFLDNTNANGPTLYLNATLYRAYLQDPPCKDRYYEAFEWLMKELGGKPHWAKNFSYTSQPDLTKMFGKQLDSFLQVRNEHDPDGVFLGAWHRRHLLSPETPPFACEEQELARTKASDGGQNWFGEISNRSRIADETTALMDSMHDVSGDSQTEGRKHGEPVESLTGTKVFDKM